MLCGADMLRYTAEVYSLPIYRERNAQPLCITDMMLVSRVSPF